MPSEDAGDAPLLRFGDFELDRRCGELRKGGVRLRLQAKPLRILELLAARPGTLVSRQDLRRTLWADDTFVDFDNSLNNAIRRLRSALGDDAARPAFVETLGRRGYRFIGPVQHAARATVAAPASRPARRLVALPFLLLRPDPRIEFLGHGLPDAVSASLAGLESLRVRSTLAAARFATAAPDLPALARELDVDRVLVGTLLRDGRVVRVAVRLLEAPDGGLVWTHSAEARFDRLFELQDTLAKGIVESLALPLSVEERGLLRRDVPGSGEAFELCLRANRLSGNPEGYGALAEARELYRRALAADPDYAPAWARLGRVHRLLAKYGGEDEPVSMRLAEEAFATALARNPELSLAHHLYAQLELESGQTTRCLRRLIGRARERPSDPQLFAGLVQTCRYAGLIEASLAADARARALDGGVRTSVCHTLWAAGRREDALAEAVRTHDPAVPLFLAGLGRGAEALQAIERELERFAGQAVFRAGLHGLAAAIRGDWTTAAAETEAALRSRFSDPEGWCYLAATWVERDRGRVHRLLTRAVEDGLASWAMVDASPGLRAVTTAEAFESGRRVVERRQQESADAFAAAGGPALLAGR